MTNFDNTIEFYENFRYNQKCSKEHKIKKQLLTTKNVDINKLSKINGKLILKQKRKQNKYKNHKYKQNNLIDKYNYINNNIVFNNANQIYTDNIYNLYSEYCEMTYHGPIPVNTNGNDIHNLTNAEVKYCLQFECVHCTCCDSDFISKILQRSFVDCEYGSRCWCCFSDQDRYYEDRNIYYN